MKRFCLSTMLALLLLMSLSITAFAAQEREENNTIDSATYINVNEDVSGNISDRNDKDWYKVTLPEDGYVTFQFNHPVISSTSSYWYMYLYQADGVTSIYGVDTSWSIAGNADKTTAEMGLAAGTYYIKIIPEALTSWSDGRYDTSTYVLRVNYTASDAWETEINNSYSEADTIAVNTDCNASICGNSDKDWYCFELKGDCEISLTFSHESNGDGDSYWAIYLYAYDGVTGIDGVDTEWYVPGNENLSTDFIELSAGTYYIKIIPEALTSWSDGLYDTGSYVLNVSEKHDHVYTEWNVSKAPTCDEVGVSESTCNICGSISTENIDATGHAFSEWAIDREPTCETEGQRSCICSSCGYIKTEKLDKLSHQYSEWMVSVQPSCTEKGQKTCTCIACGEEMTEPIDILPHAYGAPVQVGGSMLNAPIVYNETCDDCGHVNTIEDNQYAWILPAIIIACVLFVALIVALIIFKNRKKIFKTHFVCPYCFETHKMSEVQFRCSNNLCKDVPDIEMTRYENGDVRMPKQGKITFKSADIQKGEKAIPKSAVCPECHRTTHKVICPSCHNLLPESALLGEDMIISIVGSRDTGKSHFVGVIINELIERIAPAFGGSFEGFDDTMDRYEQSFGRRLYVDLHKLDLTQSSLQNVNNGAYRPLIFSLKFRVKKGAKETIHRYTLVFFDTAGEDLVDADTMSTVNKYICKSSGIIFLLDPMKIPAVATQLDDDTVSRASSVDWRRSIRSDDILVRVSNLIRNDRGLRSSDKIDIPVAAVFSKFDAIESIIPRGCTILNNSPHCKEKAFVLSDWHNVNSEVQGFLRTWGAESFLSQLDVNYTDFSCFAVSSLGLNNNPTADSKINRPRPHRIEDPLLWILMKLKVIKSKK